jgi:hypothetical protein
MMFYGIRSSITFALLAHLSSASGRTFTDDLGVTHKITGKPKFVTYALTAVALQHLGM